MMNTQNKLLKLGLAALLTGLTSTGVNADATDGTATAVVIAPLSIAETTAMDFGTISGGPAAGTVVITDFVGTRNATGDAQVIGGAGVNGAFQITGESGQAYTILYTNGVLDDGAGNTMSVDTFVDNSLGTLPAATETFSVRATLNVGANQPAGNYTTATGTPYTVTVNYN